MTEHSKHQSSAGSLATPSRHDPAVGPHDEPAHGSAHGGHDIHAGHSGHDKHAGHDPEVFRRRFWLILLMSIPVVVTSEMIMDWFGYELSGVAWVGPVLGSFVFFWGGWPFLKGAVDEVRDRAAGDDAADRDGDHRGVGLVDGVEPRLVRPRVLVGARRTRDDHAARATGRR